jgi:hypothetical protein
MAGRVRRVLLGAAVQAVLAAHPLPPNEPDPRPAPERRETS